MKEIDLPRPHKWLDGMELESWFSQYYFDIIDEWECSDIVEHVDFWDWVADEYPDEFNEFCANWKEIGNGSA